MKTSTALIIGGAAIAIIFIWSRSSSGSALLGGPKPATSTSTLASFLGGAGAGLAVSKLLSPGASSSTSVNTTGSIAAQNTADYSQLSNYTADATAASDDASGVVGFGGWDD